MARRRAGHAVAAATHGARPDGKRANEVSSAEGGAAGTVRVVRASCDPVPVLELEIDATLGSEVQQGTLDVVGTVYVTTCEECEGAGG